jgi:hypothetical protein
MLQSRGAFLDLERVAPFCQPVLSRRITDGFCRWGIENRLSLDTALDAVRRFPVAGLRPAEQTKLTAVVRRLASHRRDTAALPVAAKIDFAIAALNPRLIARHPDLQQERNELSTAAIGFGGDTDAFLAAMALQSDTDLYDQRAEAVALLTMHAAKGLEFPVVFIAGCENGTVPLTPPDGRPCDTAEERRLFYVAMTRTRQRLYLTYSRKRRIRGKMLRRQPSPFLAEIQDGLKQNERLGRRPRTARRPSRRQLPLFD